jgi:hypothetical protein
VRISNLCPSNKIRASIPKTVTTNPSLRMDSHSIRSFFDSEIPLFFERIAPTANGSVAEMITQNISAGRKGIWNMILSRNAIKNILITTPKLASILVGRSTLLK